MQGRTALVTGGSRGIGRAIVERLVRGGVSVVFSYRSDKAAADHVLAVERPEGVSLQAVQADLADQRHRADARGHNSTAGRGRIVNISTLNTVAPTPAAAVHAASKAATEQFAACAARELGSRKITVNCVLPGATDTDLLRDNNPGVDVAAAIAPITPLGRLGQPDDIADAVAFLISDDGRWITGQNLRAGGGLP